MFQTFVKNIPITWGEYEYDNMNEWKMKEFCIKKDMEEIKILWKKHSIISLNIVQVN